MRRSPQRFLLVAVALGVGLLAASANAGIQFETGNIQYTNVNIAADAHGMMILGEVDHTGVMVEFRGFGLPAMFPPIEVHGQHGVAFIESYNPMDDLYRLTMTAQAGWAFLDVDWKLDAKPLVDGMLTFMALDAMGVQIPLSMGTDTFFFDHNGQNPFHAHADPATAFTTLVFTSTVPILDLKEVSVNLVPGPGSLAAVAVGLMALRRRRP